MVMVMVMATLVQDDTGQTSKANHIFIILTIFWF